MNFNRRHLIIGSLAAVLGAPTRARVAMAETQGEAAPPRSRPPETLDLWPGVAPGMPAAPPIETVVERSSGSRRTDRAVAGITRPRIAVVRPRVPNGAAVMVIPGGGYQRIVFDKEGYEIGDWLALRGLTVFVLFYRLPGEGWAAGPDVALADAQRGMRLIRSKATDYGIDPARVAALGFSAGGHLCADLATRFALGTYEPADDADELPARPFVAAQVYPVISMSAPIAHTGSRERLIGADAGPELERAHSPQHNVSDDSPPCFLVHAEDDASVPVENSLEFRAALRARGVPVETHLFSRGGHGFALRKPPAEPVAEWPELFVAWADAMGLQ